MELIAAGLLQQQQQQQQSMQQRVPPPNQPPHLHDEACASDAGRASSSPYAYLLSACIASLQRRLLQCAAQLYRAVLSPPEREELCKTAAAAAAATAHLCGPSGPPS
eukprot:scaffold51311_cov16-Tisochrysis_lutea.AAC.2